MQATCIVQSLTYEVPFQFIFYLQLLSFLCSIKLLVLLHSPWLFFLHGHANVHFWIEKFKIAGVYKIDIEKNKDELHFFCKSKIKEGK